MDNAVYPYSNELARSGNNCEGGSANITKNDNIDFVGDAGVADNGDDVFEDDAHAADNDDDDFVDSATDFEDNAIDNVIVVSDSSDDEANFVDDVNDEVIFVGDSADGDNIFEDDAHAADNDDDDFVDCDTDFENSDADDEGLKEFLDKQALKDSEEFAKAIEKAAQDGEKDTADQPDEVDGMAEEADNTAAAAAEALAAVCNQRNTKTPHVCSNTGVSTAPIDLCETRNAQALVVSLQDRSVTCAEDDELLTSPRYAAVGGLTYEWIRAKDLKPNEHSVWCGPWYPIRDSCSAGDETWALDSDSDFVNTDDLEFPYKLCLRSLPEMEKAMAFCRLLGMVNADGSIGGVDVRARIFLGSASDAEAVRQDILLLTGLY
ncbi:hypothetical protein IWW50_001257, partial [Coemansia erecta]